MSHINDKDISLPNVATMACFNADKSGRYVKDGYAIYPNALVFKAGNYIDKGYSMTPEEMWLAVESFRPVSGNIEHSKFLHGRACHVRSLSLDEGDPHLLRAEMAVPLGLDELLGDEERQLSCEWNRQTKTLDGIALVVNPRVPGASLISTFSAVDDEGLSDRMFALFTARKTTEHAKKHIQIIHDVVAVAYPGICAGAMPAAAPPAGPAAMSDSPEQIKAIRRLHATTIEHGATCPGKSATGGQARMSTTARPAGSSNPTRYRMSKYTPFLEAIGSLPDEPTDADMLALFRAAPRDAIEAAVKDAPPDPLAAFADNPHFKAQQAELATLKAEREAEKAARALAEAVAFAEVTADRLLLNKDATAALGAVLFHAAESARRDAGAVVTFAAGAGDRSVGLAEAIKEVFAAIPDSPLAAQVVDGDGNLPATFKVLRNGPAVEDKDEIRRKADHLHSLTPEGRALLQRRKARVGNG